MCNRLILLSTRDVFSTCATVKVESPELVGVKSIKVNNALIFGYALDENDIRYVISCKDNIFFA